MRTQSVDSLSALADQKVARLQHHRSCVLVSRFDHLAITAGMLAWDKANPSGEMPPILELRTVANGGNDRGGGLRPNAFNFRNSLAGLALPKYPFDLLIKRPNPTIKVTKKIIELAERFSRHRRQFVLQIRKDLRDRSARTGNALGDGEAAIEQEATDLTNDGSAMIDHSLSCPMQCLDVLLRDRLLRDKRDVRLPCGYADRLRVIAVILLPAHKRFHILRANNFNLMPNCLKFTCPVERARAGLDDNGARTNLRNYWPARFGGPAFRIGSGPESVQLFANSATADKAVRAARSRRFHFGAI